MQGDWPYPFWIAHRGAGTLAPENTMAAFRLGAQHGYRCFECDVKLSADGVPFLLHDATLERTTSGHGVAGDLSWAQLAKLDAGSWHGPRFAGEPLPTLQGLADYLLANGFTVNLELKPTPGHAARTGAAVAAAVLRLWHGQRSQPLLSSFEPDALRAARATAPHARRALLLDRLPPAPLELAQALQCAALVTDHALMDEALAAALHAVGLRALVYTVNDAARARQLLALGVDGIITDAVDRLGPGAQAHGQTPDRPEAG